MREAAFGASEVEGPSAVDAGPSAVAGSAGAARGVARSVDDTRARGARSRWLLAAALAAALLALGVVLRSVDHEARSPGASGGAWRAGPAVARIPASELTVDASSYLPNWRGYTFTPANLLDDDAATSWQPMRRSTGGVGEWVLLRFDAPHTVTAIELANGLQRTDELGDLYVMNNRVARATLQLSDGSEHPVRFRDSRSTVLVSLPAPRRIEWLRLTVESVYPGSKWNDLALSELHVLAESR